MKRECCPDPNEHTEYCPWMYQHQRAKELESEFYKKEKELTNLKASFTEFVETVDTALLLDDQLADAWDDLLTGVIKARRLIGYGGSDQKQD